MVTDAFELARRQLSTGPLHAFRDGLDPAIPQVAAGCYTVWDDTGRFVYAGMGGRGLTAQDIEVRQNDPRGKARGVRDRLAAHRNGRRSGDQFAVYVFDRFVLGSLTPEQLSAAVAGKRKLDDDVQMFIREHLYYRWWQARDGTEAFALEVSLVTAGFEGSLPFLNPREVQD
jgi:hypothetical protein